MTFNECRNRFFAACVRLREFGAEDGEPAAVFRGLLRRAANGKDVSIPTTAREWQLYSSMDGSDAAAATLAEEAAPCVEMAKQAAQVVMYLKGD